MEKEPGNKSKMIELFSKLQEKGTPPEGIAPSFGFFWFVIYLSYNQLYAIFSFIFMADISIFYVLK